MFEQRVKGCFLGFSGIFLLFNLSLFVAWVGVDSLFGIFSLTNPTGSFIYLIAIPVALAYSAGRIRKIFQRSNPLNLWTSTRISLRFSFFLFVVFAFIYIFLKDVWVSRLFLLSYLPIAFLSNIFLIRFGPAFIEKLLFGENKVNAAILAHGKIPQELVSYLNKQSAVGIQLSGYFAEEEQAGIKALWLGPANSINEEDNKQAQSIDIVYAYGVDILDMAFRRDIDRCIEAGMRINVYSNLQEVFADPVHLIEDGELQFISFNEEPLQNPINRYLKRIIDLIISIPVCFLLLPFLWLIAFIFQKFQSPGPVIFKQTRYGINRRPFNILKFRTMKVSSENEEKQATRNDDRIYSFGKFLRRTSLDEIPQFINVIKGEMSVVGPRPHLTLHDEAFEKNIRRYRSRHFVKPGITGLAQVNGYRGELINKDALTGRIKYDLDYISNWTLSRELFIVIKTVWLITFPPKEAY